MSRSETIPLGDPYLSSIFSWNRAVNSGVAMLVIVGINLAILV